MGPVPFNIFINNPLTSTKDSELHNFADDNTIASSSGTLSQLIKNLQSEANKARDWFKMSNMIVSPEKFQAITIDKKSKTVILQK